MRNYLCAGYKKFFLHIRKYLRLENGLRASLIMQAFSGPIAIPLPRDPSP